MSPRRTARPAASATPPADRPVAVGLCRCSTDRQDYSIGDQEHAIQAWSDGQGVRLLEVFKDEGVTGLDLERPGLLAMLQFLADSPRKGTVVIWKRDRLVRPEEPIKGLLIEYRIKELGWKLHYLAGQPLTGHPLVDSFMSLVEHYANGETSRKVAQDSIRSALARLREGNAPGAKIPYGYAKVVVDARGKVLHRIERRLKHRKAKGERTRWVLGDHEEVATVRWIFREFLRGDVSPAELARMLEERAAPRTTPTIPWCPSQVREILVSRTYVGDVLWNRETSARCLRFLGGEFTTKVALHASRRTGRTTAYAANDPADHIVFPDHHPPIVTREELQRAGELLKERARTRSALNHTTRIFALTGILVCAECGIPMLGISTQRKNRAYRYYQCAGQKHRPGKNQRRAVTQRDFEDGLIAALIARFEPASPTDAGWAKLQRDVQRVLTKQKEVADPRDETRRLIESLRQLPSLLRADDRRLRRKALLALLARVELRWCASEFGPSKYEAASVRVRVRPGLASCAQREGASEIALGPYLSPYAAMLVWE